MPITTDSAGNAEYRLLGRDEPLASFLDLQTMLNTPTPSLPAPIKSYTTALLPSGLTSAYAVAFVTDANATTRLSTPAAGDSNKLLVFTTNNGTDWLIL